MKRKILESQEDYLETILILLETQPVVRSIDLAAATGYSKPSISRAVHLLESKGYLVFGDDGALLFTEEGLAIAQKTYERHKILTDYFKMLGIDPVVARQDACRVEHVISEETFQAIKDRMQG